MKLLALLFRFHRSEAAAPQEDIRAARLAELRQLLAEIAEPPCPCRA